MTWNWKNASLWQRLLVALLIVGAASAFRAVFFGTLGRGIPYLVFYPAVMLAALYGGFAGGLLATSLSVPLSFFWVQRSYLSSPEWLGMMVFVLSCLTVSAIGEAMRRAQKKAETANQELQREMADHKRSAGALQESEERFRILFEHATDGMLLADAATKRFTLANQQIQKLLGYSAEEILQLTVADLHPSADLPAVLKQFEQLTCGETPLITNIPMLRKDGTVFYADISASVVRLYGRDCLYGIFRDNTERKRAEEELQKYRDHLEQLVAERTGEVRAANAYNRGLIEANLDPLVTISPEGKITDVNAGSITVTGVSREKLIGTDFSDYFTEPDKAREGYRQVFAKGFVTDYPLTIRHKTGRFTHVLYNAVVYKDARGTVLGVFAAARDITKSKQAEDQIVKLNEDLTRRTAELEAVNHELEAFSYSVSHDLKAPLRSVDGYAKMLEEDYAARLDDEGRRLLKVVRDSARDMGQLVTDLLTFSRLSRKELTESRLDLRRMAEDARRQVELGAAGRTIRWEFGDLPPANGDEATIREVLLNLFTNAVKFTRPKQQAVIGFAGHAEAGEVVYTVSDNGVGFDMTYKDKLFSVFQRLHTSDEFEGTGIGLALVQRIIQRHGGRVWAEGVVDKGARFYFTLPREGKGND